MAWILLVLAGALEICWVIGLKHSDGFTRPGITVVTLLAALLSLGLLAQAAKTLELGVAYAVWTGIGVGGTAIVGFWLFSEDVTVARVVCVSLILVGTVGLKVLSPQ
jgi:quaternary ammonium compound-resistance protein SugE